MCHLCILVLISCLLSGNHWLTGDAINLSHLCWISCELLCMFVLSEVREICHELKDLSMHIVREEHWAANLSHVSWWKFQLDTNPQISYENIFCCWMLKALKMSPFICCPLSSRYGCPKLRFNKNEKSNAIYLLGPLYRRHGGTPLWHLVKTYVCDENPWKSKLIRTRCEHY